MQQKIYAAFIVFVITVLQIVGQEYGIDILKQETINNKQTEERVFIVVHIVDGDTFDVDSGERIRMLGIDTPERGEYFYKEAKNRLAELIEGKEVKLVKDVSERDRYGRLLRHVYYNNEWINKKMIDEGFARFVTFPPDVSHVEVFEKAQRGARDNKRGMWAKP